jgi:hypothetical protein
MLLLLFLGFVEIGKKILCFVCLSQLTARLTGVLSLFPTRIGPDFPRTLSWYVRNSLSCCVLCFRNAFTSVCLVLQGSWVRVHLTSLLVLMEQVVDFMCVCFRGTLSVADVLNSS